MAKFSWAGLLGTLAALTPTIVAGTSAIKSEANTSGRTQAAVDALNLATGVSELLLSADPIDQQLAKAASAITLSIIQETSRAHAATGLPSLSAPAPATPPADDATATA